MRSETNAICSPVGAHTGSPSYPGSKVSLTSPVPSVRTAYISRLSTLSRPETGRLELNTSHPVGSTRGAPRVERGNGGMGKAVAAAVGVLAGDAPRENVAVGVAAGVWVTDPLPPGALERPGVEGKLAETRGVRVLAGDWYVGVPIPPTSRREKSQAHATRISRAATPAIRGRRRARIPLGPRGYAGIGSGSSFGNASRLPQLTHLSDCSSFCVPHAPQ